MAQTARGRERERVRKRSARLLQDESAKQFERKHIKMNPIIKRNPHRQNDIPKIQLSVASRQFQHGIYIADREICILYNCQNAEKCCIFSLFIL